MEQDSGSREARIEEQAGKFAELLGCEVEQVAFDSQGIWLRPGQGEHILKLATLGMQTGLADKVHGCRNAQTGEIEYITKEEHAASFGNPPPFVGQDGKPLTSADEVKPWTDEDPYVPGPNVWL